MNKDERKPQTRLPLAIVCTCSYFSRVQTLSKAARELEVIGSMVSLCACNYCFTWTMTSHKSRMMRLLYFLSIFSCVGAFLTPVGTRTRTALRSGIQVSSTQIKLPSCLGKGKHQSSSQLSLFATSQDQPSSKKKKKKKKKETKPLPASLLLRTMSAALCTVTATNIMEQPLSTISVRLSTAAIAWLDFAPTATKQWNETTLAIQANPSNNKVKRFYKLVRIKFVGEMLGLGVMVASTELVCLGASLLLASHLSFWLFGGGPNRVDAKGNSAPLPPPLVKSIFAADAVLLAATLLGGLGPLALRPIGAYAYSALVTLLCAEKIKSKFSKSKKQSNNKANNNKTDADESDSPETTILPEKETLEATSWDFDWRKHWYPLAFSKITDKEVPHRLELFGEHLVLWHDGNQWAALADECPHRLAPLSEGRIDEEGQIECPYHGWTFTNQGSCTKIPQATAPSDTIALKACSARSYRVVEKQGIIWAWGQVGAQQPDESLVPICPALEDERFVWIDFSRDLPYASDTLLENVLDSSHVPFTHHKTISRRDAAKPLPLALTTPVTSKGFEGEMASDVPIGRMGEENAKQGLITERTTGFVAPTYMRNTIKSANAQDMDYDKGRESWTVVYATPTGPGRSRLLARFPFRFPPPKRRFLRVNIPALIFKYLPDWVNHMGQMKVTDDDNIFLPIQERHMENLGGWKRYKMPTKADEFVRGFRRWYDKVGPPPHSPFATDELAGGIPSKDVLLDRASQHTQHCSSCQGALKNARRLRDATRAALIVAVAVAPTLVIQKMYKTLGGVFIAAGVFAQVRKMAFLVEEALTSGLVDYPPPRNRPEMKGRNKELRTVEEGRKL